jgi:flagellar basal-body rod protein FlgB
MLDGLTNADSIPVLERAVQFAGSRHRVIVDNIANLSTPGFRPRDVDPGAFQAQLGEAIDHRRSAARAGGSSGLGALPLRDSQQVLVREDSLVLRPEAASTHLFHDGSQRDLERTMQDLVENFMVFRSAAEFLRSRFEVLNTAIRERI